jgi:kynurenine formamidase
MVDDSQPHRTLPTESEIRSWFDEFSNWGRWGEDDLLGTLNLISAAKRREAAELVTAGRSVSCAWDIRMDASEQSYGEHTAAQRWMHGTGLDLAAEPTTGPRTLDGSFAVASEMVSLIFHGRTMTHLDALSHVFWEGRMYGGLPSSQVTDRDGAINHDVLSVPAGFQSRGVLLDIPRAAGVDALEPAVPVFPEDLEAAEAAQDVTVGEGDILLVRTGDGHRRRLGTWNPAGEGQPGLHAACIPWLAERGVAALGSDVPQEVRPSGYPGLYMPLHAIGIVAMGLWLIDNCQLEDLGVACAEEGKWEFFLSVAPLRLTGATGSPVNPVAVF